jgi:uncharacterized protein (TIGR01244 family)
MNKLSALTLALVLGAPGCASTPPTAVPAIAGAMSPAPGIVTGGRLHATDIAAVRDAGIRQVIDLTPDAETPDFDEAAAVRGAGLAYANLPLHGAADLTRDNVVAFDRLIRDAKRPVLVHCASGNRVGAIAALRAAWVQGKAADDAIAVGRAWGLKSLQGDVRKKLASDSPAP